VVESDPAGRDTPRKSGRKHFGGAAALALLLVAANASAQTAYPARAIRIVAPSAAGGAADTMARILAQPLSERLGQPVIVDARPGAGTIVGTEIDAKAQPDGYTLLVALPALAINTSVYKTLPYDALRDFTAITQAISQPNLFVVHPSLPVKNVKELIALARVHPGELTFGSSGVGTSSHLTVELFLLMTGTRMLHVPFKGPTPAIIDLVAGRVSLVAASTIASLAQVRSGRLRALGVSTSKRVPSLPDIPTIAEAGVPGYESVSWFGLAAPAAVPKDILMRLYNESVAILRTREIQERFAKDGSLVVAGTPQEFRAYIRSETVKWAKVVKSADIKPE
jgi:tripartite-type tricarboxylate transporter receptor subunit TctC